jgi:hypothetical protein
MSAGLLATSVFPPLPITQAGDVATGNGIIPFQRSYGIMKAPDRRTNGVLQAINVIGIPDSRSRLEARAIGPHPAMAVVEQRPFKKHATGAGSKPAPTIRSQELPAHDQRPNYRLLSARNAARRRPRYGHSAHSSRLFPLFSPLPGKMKTLKTPT